MITMRVCKYQRIQVSNPLSQHLLPEVRARVNYEGLTFHFNMHGSTETLVPVVQGKANVAGASDYRDSL
jgi:hypothetical protein